MPFLSPTSARLCVLLAAALWSLNGLFVRLLTQPATGELAVPAVPPLWIACLRCLFAGLVFLPFIRRSQLAFSPVLLLMVACFAVMNALFISAMSLGSSANAILLQNTAPLWIYLVSVLVLKEPSDRRNAIVLSVAFAGITVIVLGAWNEGEKQPANFPAAVIALGSGLAYAGVVLCIRMLRHFSTLWLTLCNHFVAALALLPIVVLLDVPRPEQVAFLVLFGVVQMAVPYWLVTMSLRRLPAHEVGVLGLTEPLLTPIWVYLVFPQEVPSAWTFAGGALILGALAWRYLLQRTAAPPAS